MDQDSTNGTSNDKPKWRDRLGIGAKDMPKISDEFKSQSSAEPPAKPEGRAPQPVIKLAPMAPRAHATTAVTHAGDSQRVAEGQNAEGLAEKLRAQRAAAEMLAVQRVSAARQRAEARIAAEPRSGIQKVPANDSLPKEAAPSRPKFSFADEDPAAKRQEPSLVPDKGGNGALRNPLSAPSLMPPRPALGGEKAQPSLLRQTSSPFRTDSPSAFRPIDPATGYPAPSSRTAPFGGHRVFSGEPGGFTSSNSLTRKPSYDPFGRGHASPPYGNEDGRSDPRFGRSLPGRGEGLGPEEEPDDVFEEEAPPPRRAGPNDYRSAYREVEEGDTEDRRRSNGPWLLLLALLVAAFATGGVIWWWKGTPVTTATAPEAESVPVIEAPEEPAKTAAEKPVEGAGDLAAVNRKQIYDRIVGDREVTGAAGDTVVPTEVTPIQPEPDDAGSSVLPRASGSTDPEPDDVVPLALPPAPGQNIEGRIDQGTEQKVVAASQPVVEEVRTQTTTQSTESISSLLPATGTEEVTAAPQAKATDTSLPAGTESSSTASTESSAATTQTSTASTEHNSRTATEIVEPETSSPPPVKKKPAATKKKKPAAEETASLGTAPVVIVPPGEVIAPSQETADSGTPVAAETAQKQPPVRRKRTLFDLFSGNKSEATPSQNVVVEQPAPQSNRLASLPAETITPAPEKQTGSSGYVVQLASFRSQDEAQSEYARLRAKYPSVIGSLPSSISQATVAGSTRHRLGLGPLATRDQASQICSSLIAGGERDCLVRKQ